MNQAMARFEVVAGRAIGMSILVDDELLIGRHADGAGRLADDEEISRSHARISLDRSGFCAIEDLGSTNGTFVNGLRLSGPQTLSVGDTIEIGGTTLVVRELPIPASERSLKAVPPRPTLVPGTSAPQPQMSQETTAVSVGGGRAERGAHPTERSSGPRPAPPAPPPPTSAPPTEESDTEASPAAPALRLDIDFATREVTVAIGEDAEPIRLVYDGDAWRPQTS
jgi:predicted component of type VI protein secretion system